MRQPRIQDDASRGSEIKLCKTDFTPRMDVTHVGKRHEPLQNLTLQQRIEFTGSHA